MALDNYLKFKIVEEGLKEDIFGDKIYTYKITSKEPEDKVKEFCVKTLESSFLKGNKPNVFSSELIEFKNITNLNNTELGDMYSYTVKCFKKS